VMGYSDEIKEARRLLDAGLLSMVGIWTLDKESSMEDYVADGTTSVMTNIPRRGVNVANKLGLTLATPDSTWPASHN
jgi:hypothetical protein